MMLHGRFRIVGKLGYGTFSTVWLARDKKSQELVAVKVGIADFKTREVDILSGLADGHHPLADKSGCGFILPVLDQFDIRGLNGVHRCYVAAAARESLSGVKERSYKALFQPEVARSLAAQLVLAVAFVHSNGYVHGDLHLKNILLRFPTNISRLSDRELYAKYGTPDPEPVVQLDGNKLRPGVPSHVVPPAWFGEPSEDITLSECRIILSDFGVSFSPEREPRCESHAPMAIRPPETRFEPDRPLSFSSDTWMLACALWSILSQRPLFDGMWALSEESITREQADALGLLPPKWWRRWQAGRHWYTEAGEVTNGREVWTWEARFEDGIQNPRRDGGMPALDSEESAAFLAMIRSMLSYRPEDRPTAKQVLDYEWMMKWALPAYKQLPQDGQVSSEGKA